VSPLRAAEDAVRIVTDGLSIDDVLEKVIALVEAR
jgi:cytidylate kinase